MVSSDSSDMRTQAVPAPRFLVVGAGGIGGVIAASLIEQGHDVTTLTKNPLIADAINAHGFRVRGEATPGTVRGVALTKLPKTHAKFDFVLLATQPPQVEEAAVSALPALADDGAMVCFQNGLCEERVARIAGEHRVIGAIVAWGASMIEPGIYDRTSAGGFHLGTLRGVEDDRVATLARVLECIGAVSPTSNLSGARWSKLAINCAISSLGTIGGDRLGTLMRHRFVRRLALEIMTEVVDVARHESVSLEKVSGTIDLNWIALTDDDRRATGSTNLIAKHALLLAVGARYRRLRSSMLSAIERGRPPAIEFLNGEVVTRGRQYRVPTPINAEIRETVLAIAAGKKKSSVVELRALFDRTRTLVTVDDLARQAAALHVEPVAAVAPRTTEEAAPLPEAMDAPTVAVSPPTDLVRPVDTGLSSADHAVTTEDAPIPPGEPPTGTP